MRDERSSLVGTERWPQVAGGPAARSSFYLTAPAPCPYLPGQTERKLFTELGGACPAEIAETLGRLGFRRSQNVLYRPACDSCRACVPVRIPVAEFAPSASQRRLVRAHADLAADARPPWTTDEQYALLRRYLGDRHRDGGMSAMDAIDYADMVEQTRVDTRVVEYRDAGDALVGACVTDVQRDGLSMVYSFYEPRHQTRRGLGTWMILEHISRARTLGLGYVYLGFWIAGAPRMAYKARFRPLETLTVGGWARAPVA
jgi:arginyl-tRNA--protein-N-Asp/Glu arginylyltransferase